MEKYSDTEAGAIQLLRDHGEIGNAEKIWAVPDPQVKNVWIVFIKEKVGRKDFIRAFVTYNRGTEGQTSPDFEEIDNVMECAIRYGSDDLRQEFASPSSRFGVRLRIVSGKSVRTVDKWFKSEKARAFWLDKNEEKVIEVLGYSEE